VIKSPSPVEDSLQLPTPDQLSDIDSLPSRQKKMVTTIDRVLATPDIDRWFEPRSSNIENGTFEKRITLAITESKMAPKQDTRDSSKNKVTEESLPEVSVNAEGLSLPDSMGQSLENSATLSQDMRKPHDPSESATDLWIRSLINDMVYDYRREMKEDIKGIHLDLLRIGRTWRVSALDDLRESRLLTLFLFIGRVKIFDGRICWRYERSHRRKQ
jgi:protein NEDD1